MRTFRYYPPTAQEQKDFAILFLGSVLAIALVIALGVLVHGDVPRAMAAGAGFAVLYLLIKAAFQLERKGQRAKVAQFGLAPEALHLTDPNGRITVVTWASITKADVVGGRLLLVWDGGQITIGSREIEDGMILTQEIMKRLPQTQRPTNFIPLEPR